MPVEEVFFLKREGEVSRLTYPFQILARDLKLPSTSLPHIRDPSILQSNAPSPDDTMVAGKNTPAHLARTAAQPAPRLPPLPKLKVRKPDRADANPCLGVMSSVLGALEITLPSRDRHVGT